MLTLAVRSFDLTLKDSSVNARKAKAKMKWGNQLQKTLSKPLSFSLSLY